MGTLVGDQVIDYDYVGVFQEDYCYKLKGTRYWVLGTEKQLHVINSKILDLFSKTIVLQYI
jgi:hypothetical protein